MPASYGSVHRLSASRIFVILGVFLGLVAYDQGISLNPMVVNLPAAEAGTTAPTDSAVFSGGCFWGVDAVFKHVKGVEQVTSGYSGGNADTAQYETVSTGTTGHAESVQVVYDPAKVSYDQLLKVFFNVAHDPTELNRQGPDEGTQYRSVIWYANDQQKKEADQYISAADKKNTFGAPIVTQVVPLKHFYPAEGYHQNYFELHPKNPYIVFNDWPKLNALKDKYPELYNSNVQVAGSGAASSEN
jgi:peptide-methionine (S)-S-oxide reductase